MLLPSPIDYVAMRRALVAVIMACTGLGQNQVVMAEPEGPGSVRPARPFVTLKVRVAGARYGTDAMVPTGTVDGYVLGGQRRVNLDLNAYGNSHEEAYGIMSRLQACFNQAPQLQAMDLAGLAVWDAGDINDLSALLATGYEGRAQMELILGVASNMAMNVPHISSAIIQGNVDVSPIEQVTINVQTT